MLACLNFMGSGSLIFLIFCLYNVFLVNISLNRKSILLILMSITMLISVLLYSSDTMNECVKTINYALPFIIGRAGYDKATDKSVYIKRTLLVMFLGYGFQIALMYIYNLALGSIGRSLISIWTRESIAVTLVGLLSSFLVGYSLPVIIFVKSKIHKLISLIALLLVIVINSQTATRTPFVMILLIAISLFLILLFNGDKGKDIRYILVFLAIVMLLFFCYSFNWFGIRDYFINSLIYKRFETTGLETSRTEIMRIYFNNMLKYPFGGGNVYKLYGHLPHNIWQQCYDNSGFVTALLMICITVSFIGQLLKLVKLKNKQPIEYILISIYISLIAQMALEPILNGYPMLFWNLIFIHGITSRYYEDKINLVDMTDSIGKVRNFR